MFQICAGDLNRRITIETPSQSQNSIGETVQNWSSFATVWAAKRDIRARETDEGDREQARIFTEFKIRFLTGIKAEMRISYGGIVYDIEGIQEIGLKEGMIITTKAKVE